MRQTTMPIATPTPPSANGGGPARPPRARSANRAQRRRARRSSASSWLAVVVIVALAALAASQLLTWRHQANERIDLEDVQLSAQRYAVGSTGSAVVDRLDVTEGQSVGAGETLGEVTVEPADRGAETPPSSEVLTSPSDAIVITIDHPPGSIVRAGEAVLTLYDPNELVFLAKAPVEVVSQIRVGMSVAIEGPGLEGSTTATVRSARVPATEPVDDDRLAIVLEPDDIATVAELIPDLPFRGTVDLASVPEGAPSVVSITP